MNPSTSGWIKKYFAEEDKYSIFQSNLSNNSWKVVREIGFTYGIINITKLPGVYLGFNYSQEELYKIMYLQLLQKTFQENNKDFDFEYFIQKLITFYELIIPHKKRRLNLSFSKQDSFAKLEEIFTVRWKEHFFSQSKSNEFVLNSILLSIDILAFESYLKSNTNPILYIQYLVDKLTSLIIYFKEKKVEKNAADIELINYLKKSITEDSNLLSFGNPSFLENSFIADFIIANSWNNDSKEIVLPELTIFPFTQLTITDFEYKESCRCFLLFIEQQNYNYQYYRSTNLFGNILKNTTSYIELLLKRNVGRIQKEFHKNTVLMRLVFESTKRDLTKEEKKMVKKQTLEMIKTIPSLAIFILPGGSLLLPIILKFIPSLLPSSFNENSEDN